MHGSTGGRWKRSVAICGAWAGALRNATTMAWSSPNYSGIATAPALDPTATDSRLASRLLLKVAS